MADAILSVAGLSVPLLSGSVLVSSLAVVAVGLYPLLSDEPLQESLFFLLLCLSIMVWLFGFAVAYATEDPSRALRWIRIAYLGVPLIPAALYTVSLHTLGIADRRRKTLALGWGVAAALVLLTVGTDVVIDGVREYSWGYYPRYTRAGLGVIVYVAAGIGASLREYWVRYRNAPREEERRRARLYLAAFGVGGLAVVDFLPCYGVDLLPVGHGAILAMSAIMGHTLRTHHLTELTPAFAADRILGTISDPVIVCDREGRIRLANAAALESLGYEEDELVGQPLESLLHEDGDTPGIWSRILARREVSGQELVLAARDGAAVEVSVSASALEDGERRRIGTVVVARDLRDRKELERQLREQALHDRLTGIPNRALYEDRLEQALRLAGRRSGVHVGVLYLDLDRFKAVNDTYGHHVGDRVLRLAAGRIESALRESDSAARVGGDEFAVVASGLDGGNAKEEARRVAERVVSALREPLEVDGEEIRVSPSIGIAVSDGEDSVPGERLTRRADLAMYEAKTRADTAVVVFEPELEEAADRRFRIERDLEGVADRGELRVAYQPLVAISGDETLAFEALLRWEHPELGLLTPGDFIPVAERTGRIRELDRWVLRRACRQVERWRREVDGVPGDARLMVNVSRPAIESGEVVENASRALEESGLPPGALEIEVTERLVAADTDRVVATVRSLRDLGVRVAMDDFGTGSASLRLVRALTLDGLKIDRTFVHGVAREERGRKFVRSIVELAEELGMEVVAEGVEDERDRETLERLGVTRGQGYLWSEPRWPEEIAGAGPN